MDDYMSSPSASSTGKDDMDDNSAYSQKSNSQASLINPGMQQYISEQPSFYRCPFCGFKGRGETQMEQDHFNRSVHLCQRCQRNFSIGRVLELYPIIQHHLLTEDQIILKVFLLKFIKPVQLNFHTFYYFNI